MSDLAQRSFGSILFLLALFLLLGPFSKLRHLWLHISLIEGLVMFVLLLLLALKRWRALFLRKWLGLLALGWLRKLSLAAFLL